MVLCPSMNPWMWKNPATRLNLLKIKAFGTSIEIIPPIAKKVICGDFGVGAMEEPTEIARKVKEIISEKERGFGLLTVVSTGLMLVIFGNLGRALYRILRH